MPLSFLTRRGSKKTASKSTQSRDASTITDQSAEQKREVATSDGLGMSKIPAPQTTSARRRTTTTTAPGSGADDPFLNLANDGDPKAKSRSRNKSASIEPQQLPASVDSEDNTTTLKYLQSLSQRTSRPSDRRRPSQDPKAAVQATERQDRASSENSHTATIRPRPAHIINGELRDDRPSSVGYYKTPSPTRVAYRPSDLGYTTTTDGHAYDAVRGPKSAPLEPKKQHWSHYDELASQASTAAQSGLWDELNDLKSRMRKLEGSSTRSRHYSTTTPSLDRSSILDRPKTGTTQTTTSASRRSSGNDYLSPTFPQPQPSQPESNEIHPLLHSALRKARLVVSKEVFTALESSASDALQLVACARANIDPSDMQSLASSAFLDDPEKAHKAMVRKADNMCRSLTELCIVLCEQARTTSSSNSQPFTPRSPIDATKPVASTLSSSATRPISSEHPSHVTSPLANNVTPTTNGHIHETDSPLSHIDSRRQLSDRIARLQNRANARSLDASRLPDTQPPVRHGSVVETSSHSTWAPKPLNRAATTAASSIHNTMPQDPADLMDSDASSSSSSDAQDDGTEGRRTIRAPRPTSDITPSPSAIPTRRTIPTTGDTRTHSPRDLRLSKDYTQRHPLPEALSPSLRKALENRNGSNPSVVPSRTARAGSVGAKDANRTNGVVNGNGVKRASVRTTELRQDDEDEPLSPTNGSARQSYASGTSTSASEERASEDPRRGSKQDVARQRDKGSKAEAAQTGHVRKSSLGSGSRRERLPPSTGAGLAERLEAKRQQRLVSGGNGGAANGGAGSVYGRVRA